MSLDYKLPLTTATGKARIKRQFDGFGEPISVKDTTIEQSDYIEWQISYFLPFETLWKAYRKNKPDKRVVYIEQTLGQIKSRELITGLKSFFKQEYSSRKDFFKELDSFFKKYNENTIIKDHKEGKEFLFYELSDLFKKALNEKIISKDDVYQLLDFIKTNKISIEDNYKILREDNNKIISDGFRLHYEKYPLFFKQIDNDSFVEIQLKHKQYAVGFQAMIYFCIYLKNLNNTEGEAIINRTIKDKESVILKLNKEHLINIAKAFAIGSKEHAWDIRQMLERIS